jgi:peptidoglycan hydrolase CwlO-like protein
MEVAYIGVIGTLSGVVISTLVQTITSRAQRRHDRTSKLFETELDLYARFARQLEIIRRSGARLDQERELIKQLSQELNQLSREVNEIRNSRDQAETSLSAFKDKYALADGTYPKDLPVDVKQDGARLLAKYNEFQTELATIQETLADIQKRRQEGASTRSEVRTEIDQAQAILSELGVKVLLIAEENLSHNLTLILERNKLAERVTSADVGAFERAARTELGAPRAPIRRRVNAAVRWIKLWSVRRRGKRQATVDASSHA